MLNRVSQAPVISIMAWFDPHASVQQFIKLDQISDRLFSEGMHDVQYILATPDRKVELYEKAWPEILSAFKTMHMSDPNDFYDAIITAGLPVIGMAGGNIKESGTLGFCHHYCHHFMEVSAIIARP